MIESAYLVTSKRPLRPSPDTHTHTVRGVHLFFHLALDGGDAAGGEAHEVIAAVLVVGVVVVEEDRRDLKLVVRQQVLGLRGGRRARCSQGPPGVRGRCSYIRQVAQFAHQRAVRRARGVERGVSLFNLDVRQLLFDPLRAAGEGGLGPGIPRGHACGLRRHQAVDRAARNLLARRAGWGRGGTPRAPPSSRRAVRALVG